MIATSSHPASRVRANPDTPAAKTARSNRAAPRHAVACAPDRGNCRMRAHEVARQHDGDPTIVETGVYLQSLLADYSSDDLGNSRVCKREDNIYDRALELVEVRTYELPFPHVSPSDHVREPGQLAEGRQEDRLWEQVVQYTESYPIRIGAAKSSFSLADSAASRADTSWPSSIVRLLAKGRSVVTALI